MEINEQELERRYLQYLEELGPAGRIQIGLVLFSQKVEMLKSEVRLKHPNLTERIVHLKAMQNLYREDTTTVEMISLLAKKEGINLESVIM